MANVLTFDILARDRASGAFRKISSEADKSSRHVDRTGKSFTGLSSRLGLFSRVGPRALTLFSTGLAALGVAGVVKGLGTFVSEAREAQKVGASTAQGIKTIGATSWTSVKAISALSEATSEKIGVDDELIQTSANLLLTFKNIKNAAGANNDIFNRSVVAAQDLAAKGFGNANSAAKMLGKALNDPLKGLTALGRAGVTFSAAQKKQITAFVEQGDILSAQRIIMKEVEAQVGGTAAATATAADKMRVKWQNFQEMVGNKLVPIIDNYLIPALSTIVTFISAKVVPAIQAWIKEVGPKLLPVLAKIGQFIQEKVIPAVQEFAGRMGPALASILGTVGRVLKDQVLPALQAVGSFILDKILPAVATFTEFLAKHKVALAIFAGAIAGPLVGAFVAWAVSAAVAAAATIAAAAPLILIGAAVAGLAFLVIKNFDKIKVAIKATFDWVKRNWPLLVGILTGPIGIVTILIVKNWGKIEHAFREGVATIVDVFLAGVGMIIHGAANAFGWVPKLGPKLKDAARKFDKFRDDVNESLRGIRDKNVVIRGKFVAPAGVNVVIKSGRAAGGIIPGAPSNRDNRLMPVASGEYVVNARQTQRYRPLLEAINSGEGFASGGLVPQVSTAGALHGLRRWVPSANRFMARLGGAFADAIGSLFAFAGGGAGVSRWANVILQALGLLGQPSNLLNAVLSRMRRESGGNPTIVNKWDSNWRRGTPSVGLMQVIGPTFSTYAGRFRDVGPFLYGVSTNPLANVFAGLNYAQHRYPTLEYAMLKPGGYDHGGWLMPGATLAVNSTGRPEQVLPPGDGRMRLHPADIRALGEVMGRVVLSGLGAANTRSARTADLYARTA